MRGSRYLKAIALAFVGLGTAVACGETKETPGQLMVALQSDMSFPKDVSKVRVQILVRGEVRWDQTYLVAPDGTTTIPATLAVVAGEEKSPPVEVRVIGIRSTEARTFSKVVTTLPANRVATLRIPIQWLCEGTARTIAADTYDTTCEPVAGEETSCVAGTCQKVNIPEPELPNFDPIEIFGGGQQSGDPTGLCFDVQACFGPGFDVPVSPDCKVTIPVPPGRQPNFAVKTGPNGDGICNPANTECYVALDNSRTFGWYDLSESGGSSGPIGPAPEGGSSSGDGQSTGGGRSDAGDVPPELPDDPNSPEGPSPAPFPRPDFPGFRPLQEGGPQRTFQLPPAVCAKIQQGRAQAVRASLACLSKTERYPTCGPWSSINQVMSPNNPDAGPVPGGNCPEFIPGQPFATPFGKLGLDNYIAAAALVQPRVDELRRNVYLACSRMVQELTGSALPEPAPLQDQHVTDACNAAAQALQAGEKELDASILVSQGFCAAATIAQQECEAQCGSTQNCEKLPLEQRCDGEIGGTCQGQCQGECAPNATGPEPVSVDCQGDCEGVCEGICEGPCIDVAGNQSSEVCAGWCQGTCSGSCQGSCRAQSVESPTCSGTCWTGSGSDVSGCQGTLSDAACSHPLETDACSADALCAIACRAQAGLGQSCTITRAQVYGPVLEQLRNAINLNLGPIYDVALYGTNLGIAAATLTQGQFDSATLSQKERACATTAQNAAVQGATSVGAMITAINPVFQASLTRFGQGSGGTICALSEGEPPCDQCGKVACCSAYDECSRDTVCTQEMSCMRTCLQTSDEITCAQTCGSADGQLSPKGQALASCLQTSCSSQCRCPASPPIQDQTCRQNEEGLVCGGCFCQSIEGAEHRWQCGTATCPVTGPTQDQGCSPAEFGLICSGCQCVQNADVLSWQCGKLCPPAPPEPGSPCGPENAAANCNGCTCDGEFWSCPSADCSSVPDAGAPCAEDGELCGDCSCVGGNWACEITH